MTRPTLKDGSFGADVAIVQECLRVEPDRDFGPQTEAAVSEYQFRNQMPPDGVVGPETWLALETDFPLPEYPPPLYGLTEEAVNEISQIARNSQIAGYVWHDRGIAPAGYINGMAIAFAVAVMRFRNEEPIAEEMAREENSPDEDALAWYREEFHSLGMSNDRQDIDTLRHLYVLMLGLGMRESSGRYCEGRDMSADNVSSDTAEAGLFQMSWNANACSTSMRDLFDAYNEAGTEELGYADIFSEGVSCSESEWSNYGSGDGQRYQWMAKHYPLFACETVAIGLRSLRQHWGPINRKEVELRREADDMLFEVQEYITASRPERPPPTRPPERPQRPPHPTVLITVEPPDSVRVLVGEENK